MVGHSKWSKVKHIKGSLGVKHGAAFSKLVKEITVEATIGGGPFRLCPIVGTARDQNMLEKKTDRAADTQYVHPDLDISENCPARLEA